MVIVSAGHAAHGKTTLLQALTGAALDRLPGEKPQDSTVDLNYAWWPRPDGRIFSFIDVPGHQKHLANMLSGVTGPDHALLAVAADDGIMPQTREHLAILQLSGQPPLTIAITKADLANAARISDTEREIRTLAALMGWPDVTLFVTSALNATGISALADHISQLPPRAIAPCKRFRLAIDRAFSVPGTGTVVTGTALGGEVRVGDRLWLTGMNKSVRVQGLRAQNQPASVACGGQRLALNLVGGVEKSELSRGDWLLQEPPAVLSSRVVVALQPLQPLKQAQRLHIHHAASHITGSVTPMQDNLAELTLDKPLWLADNDRLILRDITARQTLAGARVVLLMQKKGCTPQPDATRWLQQLANAQDDEATLRLLLQARPWRKTQLAWARQLTAEGFSAALSAIAPVEAGDYLLLAEVTAGWRRQVLDTLAGYHRKHEDRPGLGRSRLRRMALPGLPEAIGLAVIDLLLADGALAFRYGWLRLPAFSVSFTPEEQALWQQAKPLLAQDSGWVRDMAACLNADEALMRLTLQKAASSGEIAAIVHDRYYSRALIERFADTIRQRHQQGLATRAADFRRLFAMGRKLAVQILEFFDHSGFTHRQGSDHLLRDDSMFP
ncbi:selenocysteine-specific translation elongation factor [Erwinia sp. DT-104]|uniref:Selenocysteine-specific elongation factor n=1 Tax=Erwinia aeris TaxID=3239803 RepID=A0ABV4E6Y1_9GAMM|nr:selenocysteine-specific translation elongation factor [Erwinia sp. BC051422]MDN8542764.1 selenocysteine-specific translation elongation factor [Erwinia sp. BC051422]